MIFNQWAAGAGGGSAATSRTVTNDGPADVVIASDGANVCVYEGGNGGDSAVGSLVLFHIPEGEDYPYVMRTDGPEVEVTQLDNVLFCFVMPDSDVTIEWI